MARANAALCPEIETVLLSADSASADISSTLIRQIASLGGEVRCFVPDCVALALEDLNMTLNKITGGNTMSKTEVFALADELTLLLKNAKRSR